MTLVGPTARCQQRQNLAFTQRTARSLHPSREKERNIFYYNNPCYRSIARRLTNTLSIGILSRISFRAWAGQEQARLVILLLGGISHLCVCVFMMKNSVNKEIFSMNVSLKINDTDKFKQRVVENLEKTKNLKYGQLQSAAQSSSTHRGRNDTSIRRNAHDTQHRT